MIVLAGGIIGIGIILFMAARIFTREKSAEDDSAASADYLRCRSCYYWNFGAQACSLDREPDSCHSYEDYDDDFYDDD